MKKPELQAVLPGYEGPELRPVAEFVATYKPSVGFPVAFHSEGPYAYATGLAADGSLNLLRNATGSVLLFRKWRKVCDYHSDRMIWHILNRPKTARADTKHKPKKKPRSRKPQARLERFMDDADPGALSVGFGL